jgi:predicted RNase H-like HicB family nuclease
MTESDKTTIKFDVALIPDGGGGFIAEVPGFNLRTWGEEEADALFMIEEELKGLIEEAIEEGESLPKQEYVIRQITVRVPTQEIKAQKAWLKTQIQKGIAELDDGQVSKLTTEDIKTLARAEIEGRTSDKH